MSDVELGPRRRVDILRIAGIILSLVIAVVASILLIDHLDVVASILFDDHHKAASDHEWGYPALGYVAVAGAWVAAVAWVFDARSIAVPGHIASVFAPWGYLYPLPLVAMVLALVAGATFQSGPRQRASTPK